MDQQDTAQERTQEPTAKRRADAAKRGTVLRSRELNTMFVTLGGAITLLLAGHTTILQLRGIFVEVIGLAHPTSTDEELVIAALSLVGDRALALGAPLLSIFAILALIGPLITGGLAFRLSAIAPKLEKLSPLRGFKRMFGVQSIMELLKALLKFCLLVMTTLVLFYWIAPTFTELGRLPLVSALNRSAETLTWSFVALSATLIIIAAIDLPFQAFQHQKKLRMTHQEVRDELKETEGRPEVKRRQRSLQIQAAQRRLESEVPTATVVVTNPTHFAVALRYDDGAVAPVVAARGAGELARHIRSLARSHGIPEISAPPLARALYFGVAEGQQIPADLYRAVAQILVYVLQLNDRHRSKRSKQSVPVIQESDIPRRLRRRSTT